MRKKENKDFYYHLPHYVPLFAIFAAGVLGFSIFTYDKSFQAIIVIATSISYVSWGIVHHLIHKDLTLEIIVEYLTMAILGDVLLLTVIYWS